jgi:tricorn protease
MRLNTIPPAVTVLLAIIFCSLSFSEAVGQHVIQLPQSPDLSPDGKRLVFVWQGDIWVASSTGGTARRLTETANNSSPKFSPDGRQIAFVSRRELGSSQIYTLPANGGNPKQLTYHTDGYDLLQWTADGKSLLVSAARDYDWRRGGRMFLIDAQERSAEKLLFDAAGANGQLSPNGEDLLFSREGVAWWRKGYHGSQSSQLWKYSMEKREFELLDNNAHGAGSPMWVGEGKSFIYLSGQGGTSNLFQRDPGSDQSKPLTNFKDEGVVMPCISADGSTVVFRRLFDFYRMNLDGTPAKKIRLVCRIDQADSPNRNVTLSSASDASFTVDGLEVAIIAGDDLWVMDTVLREPKQITFTPETESSPVFSIDGNSIFFVSDSGGQSDIWVATRADQEKYWWLNTSFHLKRLTNDSVVESDIKLSPAGDKIAFNRAGSGLWVLNVDGSEPQQILKTWNQVDFDWAPDGQWLTWAVSDDDFNRDVFLAPLDGSSPPLNLSRHPRNDNRPLWSPDGKMIAFTGTRDNGETDIHIVVLQRALSETSSRDRKLEEALKKFASSKRGKPVEKEAAAKSEKPETKSSSQPKLADPAAAPLTTEPPKTEPPKTDPTDPPLTDPNAKVATPQPPPDPVKIDEPKADAPPKDDPSADEPSAKEKKDEPAKKPEKKLPEVRVDFEEIHTRVLRVSIPNSSENGLVWSPDSKFLAFNATIDSKAGVYKIEPPLDLAPKFMMTQNLRNARWLEEGKQIVGLSGGTPQSLTESGQATRFPFNVYHRVHQPSRYQAGFDLAWRAMRDGFYDGNLNNQNWDAIRRKYQAAARNATDDSTFAAVIQMMLGELNGSHLGFTPSGAGGGRGRRRGGAGGEASSQWNETTAHFGLRFDHTHRGPGLLVKDVLFRSPAWQDRSRVLTGEIVLAIDGTELDPDMDLTAVLNGPPDREVTLRVKNDKEETREVNIRPISFGSAKGLLHAHQTKTNQELVDKLSQGRFGYVHIRGMNMGSFYEFERDLFAVASGKDGLVIDVRDNGGGSTADHMLTVLSQPRHAITVPRNGNPGYPNDRVVYATWSKPIVVMCNQNSFSNAEIFSHAIKTLKRGRLVGVPTAGGVISTGATTILDLGTLRMPFRGWFLVNDGEDMELNGAVPDFVLWPNPAEQAKGVDEQLLKAIEVLQEDVDAWKLKPQLELKKASERK